MREAHLGLRGQRQVVGLVGGQQRRGVPVLAGSGSCLALSEQRQLVADIPGKLARLRPFACDGRPAQNHEAKSRKSTQDPLHRNHLMADELHIVEVFPARRMIAIPESQA
jgi:hypothetical protein